MISQAGRTSTVCSGWALYTALPWRALEGEPGAQAPPGFWDPAGLVAVGGVATSERRRDNEIKHGR
eukprot:1972481-Lingulodinium_polyedra.AAC.1